MHPNPNNTTDYQTRGGESRNQDGLLVLTFQSDSDQSPDNSARVHDILPMVIVNKVQSDNTEDYNRDGGKEDSIQKWYGDPYVVDCFNGYPTQVDGERPMNEETVKNILGRVIYDIVIYFGQEHEQADR
ncbi:3678_t:CDS:1 [Paraglomus brasilianum]|uniref:3678_t:CDS:1 n=1 Tax=Paraglomus brasilianum TaxID=144538 RepID=A0A9N8ZGQ7_9GLOM|nr:3678_t:CDS:1 [Paraglomus brasilianum]